jgi:ferric-dicitrate binding protein FerR (iron transport regulator)
MTSRLSYLLERYLNKTCTEQERQELAYLALDPDYEEEIRQILSKFYNQLEPSDDLTEEQSNSILNTILQSAPDQEIKATEAIPAIKATPRHTRLWRWPAIAATLLLAVAGVYLFNAGKSHTKQAIARIGQDIKAPAADKAMIVLGNGQRVFLDSMHQQTLSLQGNVQVTRTDDGRIVYQGSSESTVFNTLINPRGSKIVHLTLQDGTRVWLNCESAIKYPIAFSSKERLVEISGEAYFEVAHDASKKFVVLTGGVKTEVLGTHFNVNAYKDGRHTQVTLLEGSVRISNNNASSLLTPRQQASLNEAGKIDIAEDVETDEVVAWKEGTFNFDNLPLNSIMQQLVRWYDVEVVYDKVSGDKTFSGIFNRSDNISGILKTMELAGIHFKIDGRKIIVTE